MPDSTRRTVGRRTVAALGAAVFAADGMTALAPTANAGTASVSTVCQTALGSFTGPQSVTVQFLTEQSYSGNLVTAYVDVGPAPLSTPVPTPVGSTMATTLTLAVRTSPQGLPLGTVTLTGPTDPADFPAGAKYDPRPFVATFAVPQAALGTQLDFFPLSSVLNLDIAGFGRQTFPCDHTGGASVETFRVDNMPVTHEVGAAPNTLYPGGTVRISAVGSAQQALGYDLCDPYGGGCAPIAPSRVDSGPSTFEATFVADSRVSWGIHTIRVRRAAGTATSSRFLVRPVSTPIIDPRYETEVEGDVNPGALTLTHSATGVQLSPVVLDGKPHSMSGALNRIAVQDFRGTTLGWSLTGQATDFTSAELGGAVPASRLTWTPSCAITNPQSPSAVHEGSAGEVGLLCVQDANPPGQVSGGEFTADAGLRLAVPAWQLAGTYTSTLTLTLI